MENCDFAWEVLQKWQDGDVNSPSQSADLGSKCDKSVGKMKVFAMLRHLVGILLSSSILGPSWGHLGPSWGPLGPVLGPSWGHLGPSWGHLGALPGCEKRCKKRRKINCFAHVGASCSHAASRRHLQQITVNADGRCNFMSHLGAILGLSWGPPGAILGGIFGHLAALPDISHVLVSPTSWYLARPGNSYFLVSHTSWYLVSHFLVSRTSWDLVLPGIS